MSISRKKETKEPVKKASPKGDKGDKGCPGYCQWPDSCPPCARPSKETR